MAVAIIPARGGSVGLPAKNIRRVGGMSLIARAVQTCRKTEGIDRVIVSTDSDEIADHAILWGAEIVARPPELARGDSTTWSALRHAIAAESLEGPLALVQCTNPMLTTADIWGTLEAAARGDMAVCVQESHELLVTADGKAVNWSIEDTLRQSRAKLYRLCGSVWAFDVRYVMESECYTGAVRIHEAERPIQVDIDTEADLMLAEAALELQK